MKYQVIGDSDCPLVQIALGNQETVKVERGSMVYISNVSLEGKMNSSKKGIGGVVGAIGRSMTSGESMFITMATGTSNQGVIGIAPPIPGKIHELKVGGPTQYRLNTGAFLACDQSVENLHKACGRNSGDWYFSGNYPTPGGTRIANMAYVKYFEAANPTLK